MGESSPISAHEAVDIIARRVSEEICPCTYGQLRSQIVEAVNDFLDIQIDELTLLVEQVIDRFLIVGDLLEVDNFSEFDGEEKRKMIFRPSPSFVFRSHDQIAFLISYSWAVDFLSIYRDRVKKISNIYYIQQIEGENLQNDLLQNGLHEIKEADWLMPPAYISGKSPANLLKQYEEKLMSSSYSGLVEDLEILDENNNPKFYRGRWVSPKKYTGSFIARRPSKFGAKSWGYAYLEDGKLQKFVDFPCFTTTGRACDEAWQFLIIKDYLRKIPQCFKLEAADISTKISFFSPLPSWVEKHLILFGKKVDDSGALMSYVIPNLHISAVTNKLKNQYWLMGEN